MNNFVVSVFALFLTDCLKVERVLFAEVRIRANDVAREIRAVQIAICLARARILED